MMQIAHGPQMTWEIGFTDETLSRLGPSAMSEHRHRTEMLLLALQVTIAKSATAISLAAVLQERNLLQVFVAEGQVSAPLEQILEMAGIVFRRSAIDEILNDIGSSAATSSHWLISGDPFPGLPASIALAGGGSRFGQIVVLFGFLASAISVSDAAQEFVTDVLAEDRPQIREVHEQCADLYSLRRVDVSRAPDSYRQACISHLASGMALNDGSDVERARLQDALSAVCDNPDQRLKDGDWGKYSQDQFELYAKLHGLVGCSNQEIIRKIAEDLFERQQTSGKRSASAD